jgi:hypothetical protein
MIKKIEMSYIDILYIYYTLNLKAYLFHKCRYH